MENEQFRILIDESDGTISSIVNPKDCDQMNWCSSLGGWGKIHYYSSKQVLDKVSRKYGVEGKQCLPMTEFYPEQNSMSAVYEGFGMRVRVERSFLPNGNLQEKYILKNLRDCDLFLEQGDIGISVPFHDEYTYADDCMIHCCHTHLWCAGNTTYVNALKMGESDINLGLIMTNGETESYSVDPGGNSNNRGVFILDCGHLELLPGEEYVWQWELFWHSGNEDFIRKARTYKSFIDIEAEQFTVFQDEMIRFSVKTAFSPKSICVLNDDTPVPYRMTAENELTVELQPSRLGEYRFEIMVDFLHTYAEFFVSEPLETVIEKRLNFIVKNQQYHRKDSHLNGAFMIYDNKKKYKIFDSVVRDHNTCRERIGMALLLAGYLREHKNSLFETALKDFVDYLVREFFDPETGEVFDGIMHNKRYVRLYNAPWVADFFAEMYADTKDLKYLEYIEKILDVYYSQGGFKFYPNAFSMYRIIKVFEDSGSSEKTEKIRNLFVGHAENIMKNGLSYPKHEVNYEQTIVSPAATLICEMAAITKKSEYMTEAKRHIHALERFNGHQPSFHLNEIPIRYWDDYWFGKARMYADTFPHYWSCLTADSFSLYSAISGDRKYEFAAEKCYRNCLCLFNEKGEGSCAYVYPYRVGNHYGQFYDEWANDQDFALYYYMNSRRSL